MSANANPLTPRELDVVRLLGSGCSYRQVAMRLGISPHTVVTHIKNAYRKLEVHTAAAAVMRAMQLGLLEVPILQAG
jgi:DNA-binding CsgD family transcriptional regulator